MLGHISRLIFLMLIDLLYFSVFSALDMDAMVTVYFGYKHKIHELVIFNQTTKIDAHKEKYFHGIVKS
jgi:hypothetical protein